jgi:hypothetical protein
MDCIYVAKKGTSGGLIYLFIYGLFNSPPQYTVICPRTLKNCVDGQY